MLTPEEGAGDTVRITAVNDDPSHPAGQTGTIVNIDTTDKLFEIRFDNDEKYWYTESSLELVSKNKIAAAQKRLIEYKRKNKRGILFRGISNCCEKVCAPRA